MVGSELPAGLSGLTAIITTLLSVGGGILGIYIAGRLRNAKPKSPERIDVAFEALEKVVKIKDDDIKHKDVIIAEQAKTIAEQSKEISYLRSIINGRNPDGTR